MDRYVRKSEIFAREWWEADACASLARTIHEDEAKPVNTGLLCADGTPLYRVPKKNPIGFGIALKKA